MEPFVHQPTPVPAAVTAFGMILRESEHKGAATLPFAAEIAGTALGRDAGSGWHDGPCQEARGASRGNADGFEWSDADSLT